MSTSSTAAAGGAPSPARRRRRHLTFDKLSFMLVFLGVPLLIYVVFVVSPFVQAVYYSLTNWTGFSAPSGVVGLNNYANALGDDLFLKSMRNNIVLALLMPTITVILSLALATLVTVGGSSHGQTRGIGGAGFYRTVSFFPYAIPAIIIGLMWGQIFEPSRGLVNGILNAIGLHQFKGFPWLGDESTAMPVTIFAMIWGFVGFYMVYFVAAIKSIPAEIFEAARIDGAGRLRTAWSITIPLIRGSVQTAVIYLGITALDAFVYMQALNPTGGPNNSTLTMSQQLFSVAFGQGKWGVACAMGVIVSLLTLVFAAIVFGVNRLTGGKDEVTLA